MNSDQRAIVDAVRHVEKALNELNKAFDIEGLCPDTHKRLTEQVFQLNKILNEISVEIEE
jgi:hypothetical protein